jgi:hypothetical protein
MYMIPQNACHLMKHGRYQVSDSPEGQRATQEQCRNTGGHVDRRTLLRIRHLGWPSAITVTRFLGVGEIPFLKPFNEKAWYCSL